MKLLPEPGTQNGATRLQEIGAPNSLTESIPDLQADRALHPAQAPHQRGVQCNQGPTMGQASKTDPI